MLSDSLRRVCELQPAYSSANTDKMQERGRLIRSEIPTALQAMDAELRTALGQFGEQLHVDASDGIGRKTEAPWVRFCARNMSPTPREGYYAVLHFAADGSALFVTVGCGSTSLEKGVLSRHRVRCTDDVRLEVACIGLTALNSIGARLRALVEDQVRDPAFQ